MLGIGPGGVWEYCAPTVFKVVVKVVVKDMI
jgi:hypothetical protein